MKSLTDSNQAGQIRLGLGQVLDYAFTLRQRENTVKPILLVEREPSSAHWVELCRRHGVTLLWPENLEELWQAPV